MKAYSILLAITFLGCCGVLAAEDSPAAAKAKSLLQQGLFAEEAERKLAKASENYEKIIADFDEQREFAVAALFRLAEVRRKQERNADAAKLYQRILAEFPDDETHARLSRENLTALGFEPTPPIQKIPDDPDETKELRRLMMLAENSPDKVWRDEPLGDAARNGWSRVTKWLLDHADRTNHEFRYNGLNLAAGGGHLEVCKLLLERGAKIEDAGGALVAAIEENYDDVAEWLIANGGDINSPGRVPFYPEIIEFVRPTAGSSRNITTLPSRGQSKAHSPPRRNCHLSPLAVAIAQDNKHWVDRLLELKADVNATHDDRYSSTLSALSIACIKGHVPLVKRLLAAGGDPNVIGTFHDHSNSEQDRDKGWTALHYAVETPALVDLLLKAGADHSLAGAGKTTPLHRACAIAQPESARLLLEAGADANVLAGGSSTRAQAHLISPLMMASVHKKSEQAQAVIKLLVKHGADILARNENGDDVFSFCDVPETRAFLVEDYLYPRQSAKKVVTLAFPHSGAIFEIAQANETTPTPPSFVAAILSWNSEPRAVSNPRPGMAWRGHHWERPNLRRSDGAGKFATTPIDLLAENDNPVLQWGDIIEVASKPSDSRDYNDSKTSVSANMDSIPLQALLASYPCKVTLLHNDQEPRELELHGGLAVRTPFRFLQNVDPYSLVNVLLEQGHAGLWQDIEIERAANYGGKTYRNSRGRSKNQNGNSAVFVSYFMDGDVITMRSTLPAQRNPVRTIRVREAKTRNPISELSAHDLSAEQMKANGVSDTPTLFQAIAMSYLPFDLRSALENYKNLSYLQRSRGLSYQQENALRYGIFGEKEKDAKVPSEADIQQALAAVLRLNGPQVLLPHPDFSVVRILRPKEEGGEEVIEIPLGDYIKACTAETPASECRAKDIELRRGDIVELKAHYDRIDQPWNGFEEATARFFTKALSYSVRLKPLQEEEYTETVSWLAPNYRHTTAGTVGLITKPGLRWGAQTGDLIPSLSNERKYVGFPHAWIRHGALIPEVGVKTRTGPPRRQSRAPRVLPTPPSRGGRVLPPPSR